MSDVVQNHTILITPIINQEIINVEYYENDIVVSNEVINTTMIVDHINVNTATQTLEVVYGPVQHVTINTNGAIPIVKPNVSNNMLLGHIEPNIIISEIFINVTEAFDNAHLTIGDDDAQGRYVVQADVNLSRVGETMIFVNEHSVIARDVKIYFDKVNTVGKLDIIIYLG